MALDAIEALAGRASRQIILNVPSAGAMPGLPDDAVVEIPTGGADGPANGRQALPLHCLGLIQEVRAYEQ